MSVEEKFSSIRKGLLEFLILRIVASDKVYVADMMKRLSTTEFAMLATSSTRKPAPSCIRL